MLFPLLSGEDLDGARYERDLDALGLTRYQVADAPAVISSTIPQDSTDLAIGLEAQASYVFRATLFVVSGTTPGVKIQLKFPFNSFARVAWGADDAASAAADDVSDLAVQSFSIPSSALQAINPSGFITTGPALDNLVVGYAQSTSSATSTVLKLGSFLTVTRVA